MTIQDDLTTPWTLHFDRDGTEDFGVIRDASGDELVRSRFFWMAEGPDEPETPPTLAALRLIKAAPRLLAALLLAQEALNTAPRFGVGATDSYKVASLVDRAIAEAKGGRL